MSRPPKALVDFLKEKNIFKGRDIGQEPKTMYFEKQKEGKYKPLFMYEIKQVFAMKGWSFPPKDIIWRRYNKDEKDKTTKSDKKKT